MDSEVDKDLLNRLKDSDRGALNELFRIYYSALCRFASSFVHPSESEEIVSDVFLAIWQRRLSLRIEISVRAYLFACVRHACYKLVSSRKDLVAFEIDMPTTETPHETLVYEQFQDHILKSVDQLPPRCRQIFMLNRFEGLKYKEIAGVMGISEKTVENHIVKALQILRENLLRYQKA